MNDNIKIMSGGPELLDRISPLWEELKKHHVKKSLHFSEEISTISFAARKKVLISKEKYLRVDIDIDSMERRDIAYCISTIDNNNKGEIDSIFVDRHHRREGVGKKITEKALTWLQSKGVTDNSIYVAYGNEEVLDFYKSFGFYPRGVHLAQKRKQA